MRTLTTEQIAKLFEEFRRREKMHEENYNTSNREDIKQYHKGQLTESITYRQIIEQMLGLKD